MDNTITLGISPCPNDTYIFHALLHGFVDMPFNIHCIMADVEELNARACAGELDATKVSAGVLPKILHQYAILRSGAALGFGCGPLLVSKEKLSPEEQKHASIAIPGHMTTAAMLLQLHGAFDGPRHEMIFDAVMPAVLDGRADMGLIIHEGRFTYAEKGLHKVLDLGQWWEQCHKSPLPLGVIAVKRSLPLKTAQALEQGIAKSIAYARHNPEASKHFIASNAQELSEEVTTSHIATYVNDFSYDLGQQGSKAIQQLLVAHPDLVQKQVMNIFLS